MMQLGQAHYLFESKNNNRMDWVSQLPIWNQVHGFHCVEVTHSKQECGDVDALWTRQPNQPIAIRTADCVPILLAYQEDGKTSAIGAIHAGWRGTFAHIVEHFFNSLPGDLSNPKNWQVVLGPSIRACCYEVSPELIQQFKDEFQFIPATKIEPKHRHLDLISINNEDLIRLGVTQIQIHPDCTFCKQENGKEKYFSYRRGDRKSRQHSIISF